MNTPQNVVLKRIPVKLNTTLSFVTAKFTICACKTRPLYTPLLTVFPALVTCSCKEFLRRSSSMLTALSTSYSLQLHNSKAINETKWEKFYKMLNNSVQLYGTSKCMYRSPSHISKVYFLHVWPLITFLIKSRKKDTVLKTKYIDMLSVSLKKQSLCQLDWLVT